MMFFPKDLFMTDLPEVYLLFMLNASVIFYQSPADYDDFLCPFSKYHLIPNLDPVSICIAHKIR